MCGRSQAYLSTCPFCHSFLRSQVLVVLDIQSKLEPAVLVEYKHITSHNHLPYVCIKYPDCLWKTFSQKTTNMISLIAILHGTLFNEKLLHTDLDHSLIISICHSIYSIYYSSAVVLRSEYTNMISWRHSNLRSIRNMCTLKPRLR